MSILRSAGENEMMITCACGCDEGLRFKFHREDEEDLYCCMAFVSGNFYRDQERPLRKKLRRIWAILRNRDYCYSEIYMNKAQFQELKEYIGRF